MPIVFIHGVNNRIEDKDYEPGVEIKREYFQNTFAPQLNLSILPEHIFFPYWGGHGVSFRWNQASLPMSSDNVVALGTNSSALDAWLGEIRSQKKCENINLGEVSREEGFISALDLFWDVASAAVPADRIKEIASYYAASMKLANDDPAPAWALQKMSLTNEEFATHLFKNIAPYVQQETPREVSLGMGDWLSAVREAVMRLGNAPGAGVADLLTAVFRKSSHERSSRFMGDVFVYLTKRDDTGPDSLLADVLMKIKDANAARTQLDDKLIVVGHSLGGLLAYDALTSFLPDIHVDYFITVGSQVALFEEMTLCKTSMQGTPPNPPRERLLKPSNIARWLNVYDSNDIFSFRIEGVFQGAEDYLFDTGYGVLGAHSGYFLRPSFYKRLAKRVHEVKK